MMTDDSLDMESRNTPFREEGHLRGRKVSSIDELLDRYHTASAAWTPPWLKSYVCQISCDGHHLKRQEHAVS